MKKFRKSSDRGRRPLPPSVHQQKISLGRAVIGIHAVSELLTVRPKSVQQLWLRENYIDHPLLNKIYDNAKRLKLNCFVKPVSALDKVVSMHQGVIAYSNSQPELDWDLLVNKPQAVLVALDEVEDPHNLGAVMRTAWLFGVDGILTPENRSAQLSPAVSKVAQGAVEHIPVLSDGALPVVLERLKKAGFWILGLSHESTVPLFRQEIPDKVVWVLGSEAAGLRKSVANMCDELVQIPQVASRASYNVSVAAAIALAETFRQRHFTGGNAVSPAPD